MPSAQILSLGNRPKPYLIAHRGNRASCPENTLAAFQQALQDGADMIETDLHLSADDHFICIHDPTLDRTTDGSGAVAELTLEQIQSVSAACGQPGFHEERVPSLPELLEILPQEAGLALELKSDRFLEEGTCRRLAERLAHAGVGDRTVILSFSLERLLAVRKVAPDLPIGWITLRRGWPIDQVEMIGPLWPWLFLNPIYVAVAHRRSQLVCPLDPNPDQRLAYYRFLSCDAVLSDNPAKTARALQR